MEEWMILPGFSNYYISNKGNVKRIRKTKKRNGIVIREVLLKIRKIGGYAACTLVNDENVKKTVYVHKAIAMCFINKPKTENKLVVVHKDGDKSNNDVANLAWVTTKEFMKSQFESGKRSNKDLWKKRVKKYGPNGSSKIPANRVNISNKEAENIYYLHNKKRLTLKKIASKYGCSISHIFNLLKKREKTSK